MPGALDDSNHGDGKGFAPSYLTELIWGKPGYTFVKSNLQNPRDPKGSYPLVPHFARTLSDLNNHLPEPISGHSVMTVDLPFGEPPAELASKDN